MKKYRFHSDEFKRSLVAEIDSGAITLSEAARQHDLALSLVERWRKQIHDGHMRVRKSPHEKQLEKELDRCKIKIADLSLQVDLLKKLNETSALSRRSSGYIVTPRTSDQSKGPAE